MTTNYYDTALAGITQQLSDIQSTVATSADVQSVAQAVDRLTLVLEEGISNVHQAVDRLTLVLKGVRSVHQEILKVQNEFLSRASSEDKALYIRNGTYDNGLSRAIMINSLKQSKQFANVLKEMDKPTSL